MLSHLQKNQEKQRRAGPSCGSSPNLLISCPKTTKSKNPCSTTFQNLKVCESTLVLAEKIPFAPCPRCQIYREKIHQLRNIQAEASYLKEKNTEFKEQIELLSNNFMYILELASENIAKGVETKLKNILAEKQNLIKKQNQIIRKLENQSSILIDKVDAGLETSEKMQELQEKNRLLEAENKILKESNNVFFAQNNSFCINSTDIYTTQSGDKSPKDNNFNTDFHFGSVELQRPNHSGQSTFGLKKRSTLDIEKQPSSEDSSSPMKSLNNLRMRINTIKSKLINQKY